MIELALSVLAVGFLFASLYSKNPVDKVLWGGLFIFTLITDAFFMATYRPQQLVQVIHNSTTGVDTYIYTNAPYPDLSFYLVVTAIFFLAIAGIWLIYYISEIFRAMI